MKLPKQWKHWCKSVGLKPHCAKPRWSRGLDDWLHLKGRGYVWRVNCNRMFERGDLIVEFDRWALCDSDSVPLPSTLSEFVDAVSVLIDQAQRRIEGAIMNKPTPFQQGQSAARQPYGTWFDCPYSPFKGPVDAYKQRQWFRGWDQETRRDSLPVIGPHGNIMIDRIRNVDRAVIGAYGQVMIARRAEGAGNDAA